MPRGAERTPSVEIQKRLRREVVRVLGRDIIKAYHRPSAARSLGALAHLWMAVAAGFLLAGLLVRWPLGWALAAGLPLSLFMATRINAMNVMVHEGSHYALAPSRRLNAWLTNLGFGYWILFDADSYRAVHMKHHRFLNQADDPDRPLYELPGGRAQLLRGLLADALWVSVARRALVYARPAGAASGRNLRVPWKRRLLHLGGKGACNGLLLGSQLAVHGVWTGVLVYVLFWVVPLFSIYPMIIRLRVVAEHYAPELHDPAAGSIFVARSTASGLLEHYLLGAQMEMHFEHHLFPGMPYAQAKRMHGELVRRGFFEEAGAVRVSHSLTGGYLRFWARMLRGKVSAPAVARGVDVEAASV